MPSQFDQVMQRLQEIVHFQNRLEKRLDQLIDLLQGRDSDLFGEDPSDIPDWEPEGRKHHHEHGEPLPDESGMEEELEVLRPKMPGVTRRLVEVKGADGKTKTVPRDGLDPKILRVLDASIKAGTFWFLYERESDGQIMISAEEQVINQVGRGEVPPSANEPDLTE